MLELFRCLSLFLALTLSFCWFSRHLFLPIRPHWPSSLSSYNLSSVPSLITAVNYTVFPETKWIWSALTLHYLHQKTWREILFPTPSAPVPLHFFCLRDSCVSHTVKLRNVTGTYMYIHNAAKGTNIAIAFCHVHSQSGGMQADVIYWYPHASEGITWV